MQPAHDLGSQGNAVVRKTMVGLHFDRNDARAVLAQEVGEGAVVGGEPLAGPDGEDRPPGQSGRQRRKPPFFAASDHIVGEVLGGDRSERVPDIVERGDQLSPSCRAGGRSMPAHVEEFWVPDHSGLVRIAASDIQRITAERDYMRLHVGARSWLIHRTIAKLEEDLDPAVFIRVHRSVILRRDTIGGLYRDEAGHWTARLKDGGEQRIGRSYVDNVKRLAGR